MPKKKENLAQCTMYLCNTPYNLRRPIHGLCKTCKDLGLVFFFLNICITSTVYLPAIFLRGEKIGAGVVKLG